ncbi:MAG: MerR family transcriptional regulator [Chloroflexota bacterium]|nr:MerR family transcriptional regulator [Chloroflexota bacterium]
MPVGINGQTYYRTSEACRKAGISKATLFRWFKDGIITDIMPKDRNGWRLFTLNDIDRIKSEANTVSKGNGTT